jgi:hypothetical protein
MIRKILPILLALVGLGIGGGAGFYLRPAPAAEAAPAEGEAAATEHGAEAAAGEGEAGGHAKPAEDVAAESDPESGPEYIKLSNQFVIPVLEKGQVNSMVILALSLEVEHGTAEATYAREPKLRDAFLQVLFDHANSGGFKGSFTDGSNLVLLRRALLEVAQSTIGASVTDVLITDIARQDS